MPPVRALGALLVLVLALVGAATAPAQGRGVSPLHATRGVDDPGIFDGRGREVLLRGVNVNGLGDYYQSNPAYPTVVPLHKSDFARIERIGFNSVRLLMSWSRLQPTPGSFNRSYVRRIKRAVGWARDRGLYVILDMHQDAWGKFIATEPGESCPPGGTPAVGWDGAPEWATLTDGLSTCKIGGLRELAPAVGQAWQSFYDDREGIQSELVDTWGRLARSFAGNSTVAGFDLLNEPNPGLAPGVGDVTSIGRFYGRAIDAIRRGEASRKGGFSHVVFFEPSVLWSATGNYPTPPPGFTDDTNIVFAPHIYAESIAVTTIPQGFDFAQQAAASYGTTVWSGEWGYFADDPADDGDKVRRYGAAEDAAAIGGAWWDYKQSCGDPHVIGTPGGDPNPISPSLVRYDCGVPGGVGTELGVARPYRDVLSRPAPRAVLGQIISLESSATAATMKLAAKTRARGKCGLRIFAPARGGRPTVKGKNLSRVRIRRTAGDWTISACAKGSYKISVGRAGWMPKPSPR